MIKTPNLVGYWPFEGNANDVSGNNYNAVGNISFVDGRFGKWITIY